MTDGRASTPLPRTARTAPSRIVGATLLWLAAGLSGCGPGPSPGDADSAPPTAPAPLKTPTAPAGEPPPAGTLERLLFDKASKYAAGLRPMDEPFDGVLEAGQRRDQLLVLEYGKCYRMLAVGGPEVEDLDLVLHDPDNVQVQRDLGEDPYPVLGDQAEICPPTPGAYRLQITMFKGRGRYLARAYRLGD